MSHCKQLLSQAGGAGRCVRAAPLLKGTERSWWQWGTWCELCSHQGSSMAAPLLPPAENPRAEAGAEARRLIQGP